ncbi:MAG: hypothetical protein JNL09_07615 [Anaerolineales bacterium]|nr:hypothetical protein [Anaerolineales bacterium]
MNPALEQQLETHTIALNEWLYAESVGLDVPEDGYVAPANALKSLYADLLEDSDPATRYFALEQWSEARRAALESQVSIEFDQYARADELACSEGPLTWRNWKAFEREAPDAATLTLGFERLIERSAALAPILEERRAAYRADYARFNTTPIHTFCWREGLSPEQLRAFLLQAGEASRQPFQTAVHALSQAVFSRPAGPAELKALYLNRMYEPLTNSFTPGKLGKEGNAPYWVEDTLNVFQALGFSIQHVPVDLENRPRKYPGAFCFPVATPHDVRVSVRIASPHHLVDMLYHEFGHAAHFAGIRADLPFVDRYWIHSGQHETFSTLFEYLLGEPEFLREYFNFDETTVERLVAFHGFKRTLTNTWLNAAALTALEGWLEKLNWETVEQRYSAWMTRLCGVPVPPGLARLNSFVNALSIYPAGYVLAEARVEAWLAALRAHVGPHWWRSPHAQAEIRQKIELGGRVNFAVG